MTSTQESTRPIPVIGQAVTAQGRGLREGVLAAAAKITGPMLATIGRGDLETTVRTLEEITRRARGIPARRTATEDHR